jgi:hypothetical protein
MCPMFCTGVKEVWNVKKRTLTVFDKRMLRKIFGAGGIK